MLFQKLNGIDKTAFGNRHHHIDGVEVFAAIKAPCQIGLLIDCCMVALTDRAGKPVHVADALCLKTKDVSDDLFR